MRFMLRILVTVGVAAVSVGADTGPLVGAEVVTAEVVAVEVVAVEGSGYEEPVFNPKAAVGFARSSDGLNLVITGSGLLREYAPRAFTPGATRMDLGEVYDHAGIAGLVGAGGEGLWVVARDGGVFALYGAEFFGSVPSLGLVPRAVIVEIEPTPSGGGYWLLGADGGVFAFGDASFEGSVPQLGVGLNAAIVDMASTPTGNGYWILGSDGGVFAFGDAKFHGSVPTVGTLTTPAAAIVGSGGDGYTIIEELGHTRVFGDAVFFRHYGPPDYAQVPVTAVVGSATGAYGLLLSDGRTIGPGGFFP